MRGCIGDSNPIQKWQVVNTQHIHNLTDRIRNDSVPTVAKYAITKNKQMQGLPESTTRYGAIFCVSLISLYHNFRQT